MTTRKQSNEQCKTCPFNADSSTDSIPGYDSGKHDALGEITLEEDHEIDYSKLEKPIKIMACHGRDEQACIGWVKNQLDVGNVLVRISMCLGSLQSLEFPLKMQGRQVKSFDETYK